MGLVMIGPLLGFVGGGLGLVQPPPLPLSVTAIVIGFGGVAVAILGATVVRPKNKASAIAV